MTQRATYGSWASPITAASLQVGARRFEGLRRGGGRIGWLEWRPEEGGRRTVMVQQPGAAPVDVLPREANVGSRVLEYGGVPYDLSADWIVYCDFATQRLFRAQLGANGVAGQAEPITPDVSGAVLRYCAPRIDPSQRFVLAVREDHRDGGEPTDVLVRLDLHAMNDDGGTVLVQGADFVSAPRPNPSWTALAWCEWNHPDMVWEATQLKAAPLSPDGELGEPRTLVGAEGRGWSDPTWLTDTRLVTLGEPGQWRVPFVVNLETADVEPVPASTDVEYGAPEWTLDQQQLAVLSATQVVTQYMRDGFGHLQHLDLANGQTKDLVPELALATELIGEDDQHVVVCAFFKDRGAALIRVNAATGDWEVIRRGRDTEIDPTLVSQARPVSWTSDDGATAYGHYYAPNNPEFVAPEGELPPLVVFCHGGPTAMAFGAARPDYAYWNTRGYALLDLNYAGSSGFGRAYRERLRHNWGIADVADAATGALAMAQQGLADPERLAIRGGSAGGYLALAALTFSNAFKAGASHYGIGDLETLARDTHKLESRYLDGLVGPYPEQAQLYRERSPIHHVDNLQAPMILLQGAEDKAVPPAQAEAMYAAVRRKGLPVSLIIFEGEGHGFRKAENAIRAIQSEEAFYGMVFGFEPATKLPDLPIDNPRSAQGD